MGPFLSIALQIRHSQNCGPVERRLVGCVDLVGRIGASPHLFVGIQGYGTTNGAVFILTYRSIYKSYHRYQQGYVLTPCLPALSPTNRVRRPKCFELRASCQLTARAPRGGVKISTGPHIRNARIQKKVPGHGNGSVDCLGRRPR